MNESSSQQPGPEAPGNPGGFFPWVRGLGVVRDPNNRWFAGVASGIARRARVDPLVIRAVFVVLAVLGGPGILLYIIGWLFLPDVRGKIHVEELLRGRSTPGVTIAAVILAVWLVIGLFGGVSPFSHWDLWRVAGVPNWISVTFTVLFWIAFTVVAIIVVQRLIVRHGKARGTAQPPAGTPGYDQAAQGGAAAQPGAQPGAQPSAHQSTAFHEAPPAGHTQGQEPHSTEPSFEESMRTLGNTVSAQAGEFGQKVSSKATEWGQTVAETTGTWSSQYAEHYEKTRMPTGQKIITLAMMLLASGGALLWAATGNAVPNPPLPWEGSGALLIAIIAATVTLAISIIIAGVRGKHTGGIGFLGFLGVASLLVIAVLPWGSRYFFIGTQDVGVESTGVVAAIGTTNVDLGDLDSEPHTKEFTITQAIGNVTVDLPRTRPIELTVRVGAGKITELQPRAQGSAREVTRDSGLFAHRTFLVNGDTPGTPVNVTVTVGAGDASITPSSSERSLKPLEITR